MADRETNETWSKISVIVMKLLHQIGINKKIRRRRRYNWMQHQTLWSFVRMIESIKVFQICVFGSQIEGSTTPDLRSDLDVVFFIDFMFAVRSIQDDMPGIRTVLMVRDDDTHPGYFKLQVVDLFSVEAVNARSFEAIPNQVLATDRNQRIVLNGSGFISRPAPEIHTPAAKAKYEIHGPAASLSYGHLKFDCIMAVKVATRSQEEISWLLRPRHNKWITQDELQYFLAKDVFLVPVGNPLSFESHLEWRISFTAIERELMWRMNNTQIACFVLMKMINKCLITPAVGESLSSYHCKTVLFHLIDNTDMGFWKPNNLLTCLNLMLKTLSLWVESEFCPNYFITNENMFLGKVQGPLRKRLHSFLVHLIDQDFRYLTQIECDGLGQALSQACCKQQTQPDTLHAVLEAMSTRHNSDAGYKFFIYKPVSNICLYYTRFLQSDHTTVLHTLFQWYQSCSTVLEDCLSVLIGLLCSHYGCQLASSCIATNRVCCTDMEMALMFLCVGTDSDVTAGWLKLAGFYLKLGYVSLAEKVLIAVEQRFKHYVSDVSPVHSDVCKDDTFHKMISEEMRTHQTFKSCIALSVIYLPSEIHCTLPPLFYEMFRSVCADPDLRDPQKHYWYDWAVMDARPYMYFLQHQTYSVLGMEAQRKVALDNLFWSITQERIRHPETCLNVLAYCLRQEGLLNLALKYLLLSLQIKPEHNAAVWQIFDMLTQLCNNQAVF